MESTKGILNVYSGETLQTIESSRFCRRVCGKIFPVLILVDTKSYCRSFNSIILFGLFLKYSKCFSTEGIQTPARAPRPPVLTVFFLF